MKRIMRDIGARKSNRPPFGTSSVSHDTAAKSNALDLDQWLDR